MKHCGTQELETAAGLLRRDRGLRCDVQQLGQRPEVTKYLRWNAHRSRAETAEILNEEKHYGDPCTFYQWGVENKAVAC